MPVIAESAWSSVKAGVLEALIEDEKPIFISALEDVISERQNAARVVHADFEKTINDLNAAIRNVEAGLAIEGPYTDVMREDLEGLQRKKRIRESRSR